MVQAKGFRTCHYPQMQLPPRHQEVFRLRQPPVEHDSHCRAIPLLFDQLKSRGVARGLSEPLRLAVWCRTNKGQVVRPHDLSRPRVSIPYSEILGQLGGMAFEPGPDITQGVLGGYRGLGRLDRKSVV